MNPVIRPIFYAFNDKFSCLAYLHINILSMFNIHVIAAKTDFFKESVKAIARVLIDKHQYF